MNKRPIGVICLCTLLLTLGMGVTQAYDSELLSTFSGETRPLPPSNPPLPLNMTNPSKGHFDYGDGYASGSSVRFSIDESTGTVRDYTVGFMYHPRTFNPTLLLKQVPGKILPSDNELADMKNTSTQSTLPYRKNTTVFTSIHIDGFAPLGVPMTYGNLLVYQGANVVMMFYDQTGGGIHYYTGQYGASITIVVPEGTSIIPETKSYLVPTGKIIDMGTMSTSRVWQSIQLTYDDVKTSISITNGTISISDRTISIQLQADSSLDTFSWIRHPVPKLINDFWYSDLNIQKDRSVIEEAKNNGVIPAEGWCIDESAEPSQVSVASSYFTYDDPSFNMSFSSIDTNAVDVVVNSEIPAGRIVIINIQKEILQASVIRDLLVSIDNAGIAQTNTLEGLMNKVEMKDTTGAYYALVGEQLITVFVYVPHFSTHTISIRTLFSSIPGGSSLLFPIFLSAAFIALAIVGLLLQRPRKDE